MSKKTSGSRRDRKLARRKLLRGLTRDTRSGYKKGGK